MLYSNIRNFDMLEIIQALHMFWFWEVLYKTMLNIKIDQFYGNIIIK